jgi:hypothetical protein
MFSVRMTRGYRRESACVFVKGAWQPGVQSERVWTTWFRRLVCTERFVFRARTGPLCPAVSSKMQLCGHRKKAEKVIGTVSVCVLDVCATKLHISHEPCVRRHRFCMTTKSPTLSDNQAETCLIITINDTSIGDLPLIITISDSCKNQPKRFDSDNTINLSSLMSSLVCHYERFFSVSHIHDERFFVRIPRTCEKHIRVKIGRWLIWRTHIRRNAGSYILPSWFHVRALQNTVHICSSEQLRSGTDGMYKQVMDMSQHDKYATHIYLRS